MIAFVCIGLARVPTATTCLSPPSTSSKTCPNGNEQDCGFGVDDTLGDARGGAPRPLRARVLAAGPECDASLRPLWPQENLTRPPAPACVAAHELTPEPTGDSLKITDESTLRTRPAPMDAHGFAAAGVDECTSPLAVGEDGEGGRRRDRAQLNDAAARDVEHGHRAWRAARYSLPAERLLHRLTYSPSAVCDAGERCARAVPMRCCVQFTTFYLFLIMEPVVSMEAWRTAFTWCHRELDENCPLRLRGAGLGDGWRPPPPPPAPPPPTTTALGREGESAGDGRLTRAFLQFPPA